MKNKNVQKLSIVGSSILMASNVMPMAIAFAESNTKDSIASVNASDDGVNVGFDETQAQKTEYSEEIESEGTQAAKVYVSQASTFGVKIPKVIILDGKKNDEGVNKANYVVTIVEGTNISGKEKIVVKPDASFKMSQEGKNDLDVTVIQDKEEWLVADLTTLGNGEVSATGMSAGMWKGEFNFDIKLVGTDDNGTQGTQYTTFTAENIPGKLEFLEFDGEGYYYKISSVVYNGETYNVEGQADYLDIEQYENGKEVNITKVEVDGENCVLTYDDFLETRVVTVKLYK